MTGYFVDTNVLLYSLDVRDPAKRAMANAWLEHLWQSRNGRLSWQVLNEFYSNAVRKMGVPVVQARETVMTFTQWMPVGTSARLAERAWYWMDEAQVSWWDSLILASAEQQGCRWLLSEDFQADRDYEGIRVINPFLQLPEGVSL